MFNNKKIELLEDYIASLKEYVDGLHEATTDVLSNHKEEVEKLQGISKALIDSNNSLKNQVNSLTADNLKFGIALRQLLEVLQEAEIIKETPSEFYKIH